MARDDIAVILAVLDAAQGNAEDLTEFDFPDLYLSALIKVGVPKDDLLAYNRSVQAFAGRTIQRFARKYDLDFSPEVVSILDTIQINEVDQYYEGDISATFDPIGAVKPAQEWLDALQRRAYTLNE